jgi:WD40 repeat protein
MFNQHAKPSIEFGKQWDLLLYSSNDLSKPSKIYDISAAINQAEDAIYDGVRSVAWSKDEKLLALATNSRIFMFNFETGALSSVYADPATGESDPSLDSSALFLSSDGKYVAFIDSVDTTNEVGDEAYNVLKKIDLEKNNEVSELLGDYGLSLKSW